MWEAIAAVLGIIASLVTYFIWKKKSKNLRQEYLEKIRAIREESSKKTPQQRQLDDHNIRGDLKLILRSLKDSVRAGYRKGNNKR